MSTIKEIEKRVLALPLDQRVFLAESLLGSLPTAGQEMTEAEEMAKVQRRDMEIERGQVQPLSEAEFWRGIESGGKQ